MKKLSTLIILFSVHFITGFSIADKTPTQLWGVYKSQKGIMNPVSCYGYNIGYFELYTTGEPETVVICFDRMNGGEDINPVCHDYSITVLGYYETVNIEGGQGSCPSGSMRVYFVTEWACYN